MFPLHHVTTTADIHEAKRQGKLGIVFHFQNTDPFGDNLDLVEAFHRLGLHMVQLTYNRRNRVGDGCAERTDAGLSHFGLELVRELNRLGIVVDCTHTGRQTTLDAIEASTRPPVFSHANALALCRARRNIDVEQMRAVAAKDGLVGIVGFPAFVKAGPNPTLDDLLDHIDYMRDRIGVDHIGIGLDYYGTGSPAAYAEAIRRGLWRADEYPAPPHHYPAGIEDASRLPNITLGLLRRGYREDDVLKILGGNWLRVFRDNWDA